MKVSLIGIDLAKTIFQVCGVNQSHKVVFNRQIRRNKLIEFLIQYPQAQIAMEACGGSNYWGRELKRHGFNVLIIPTQYVKPFVKGNKNDRNDALAITEAAKRPNLQGVEPRNLEQTDTMLIHRMRLRLIQHRTALTNQIRGFLSEYGIVVAPGKERLLSALPQLLEDAENGLTVSAREMLEWQKQEWLQLSERINTLDKKIRQQARDDEHAKRLIGIKGVGELSATAVIAHAGNGSAYKNGRHFSASLGLVPKEHSSGGKQKLSSITKRGNEYLRGLLVQGAWAVLRYAKEDSEDRLSKWAWKVAQRRGKQKAAIAVANKLARIIWAVLYHQRDYQAQL